MSIKLIIGLQNPGSAYVETRHNAGGWFVQKLAQQHGASFKLDKKLHGQLAQIEAMGHPCKVLLPTVFMNQSGLSAQAVRQFYRIEPEEILVVHDELDLPPGRIKLKSGGGHGGHNGLRDLITQLGSKAFHRLRIGIGHPGHKDWVLNYVLGKPPLHDKESIHDAIARGIQVVPVVITGDIALAMNQLNG